MKESIQECILYCKELKTLYVEDNEDARTFTLDMLKHFFNDVTIAVDGLDGLEKFKNSQFDLVLTDINMPNMNGLEMIKEMKTLNANILTIVLSAHNETDYFIASIKLAIDGFLLKPLELTQFVDTLNKVVEKLHLRKQLEEYQTRLEESNVNLEKKVQERTSELEHRIYHDSLTQLGNHDAIMRDTASHETGTVLLVDIQGFQKFNDLYGLNAGNTILKAFAEKLKKFNEENRYSLYRVYSDVFALYALCDVSKDKISKEDISELFKTFKTSKVYLKEIDYEVNVEATVGICVNEVDPFLKADMALKHAKKSLKSIVLYSPEIDVSEQLTKDLYWKDQITHAISNDNIVPVFQAIVNDKGEVIKYETLMRLIQEENGTKKLISPLLFLNAAIKTRQYDKLTRIIVQKSFAIMSKEDIDFSINLSFEDLADPMRVKFLHNEIVKHGVGKRLIMEILESEVVSDYKMVSAILDAFRERGVRVAIDDFGSGFSNFEHILNLNPDYIKIDASLIKEILNNQNSFTLVKAISEFSKELGMKVIAEYVSTKEIFEALKELSIDEYQGFYFSVPSQSLEVTTNV